MSGLPPRVPGEARAGSQVTPVIGYCTGAHRPAKTGGGVLADVRFGTESRNDPDNPARIVIATPPLGDCDRECWRLPEGPLTSGWHGDIGYVVGERFLFAHLLAPETPGEDLARTTEGAYRRLLRFVATSPCPRLLRMWNYLPRINVPEYGIERYQAFCKGRSQAFAATGISARQFPAATAIGSQAPGLSIHLLAGRDPGTPLENSRQVSAYHYPRPYGPRSPSFARALRFAGPKGNTELAISGTSSIIGHVTMHPHHLERQLRETLRNLDMLTAPEPLPPQRPDAPPLLVKVYLRDPARMPLVAPVLPAWAGAGARFIFLHGDICRAELEIEIEAHRSSP